MLAHPFSYGNEIRFGLANRNEDVATKRRIEITLEKHRLIEVRDWPAKATAWCVSCGTRTEMVTAEEAARRSHTNPRVIYRRIEAAELHYTETEDSGLLICARSI